MTKPVNVRLYMLGHVDSDFRRRNLKVWWECNLLPCHAEGSAREAASYAEVCVERGHCESYHVVVGEN